MYSVPFPGCRPSANTVKRFRKTKHTNLEAWDTQQGPRGSVLKPDPVPGCFSRSVAPLGEGALERVGTQGFILGFALNHHMLP